MRGEGPWATHVARSQEGRPPIRTREEEIRERDRDKNGRTPQKKKGKERRKRGRRDR